MDEENNAIPIGTVSSKRLPTSKPVSKAASKKAAQMILSCYPDFGKAPPEYVVNLIDVLSTYPEKTLVKLCDLRTGVVSQCPFLPSVAEIVKMADGFEAIDRLVEEQADMENRERIAREERANFIKAQEARLVDVRKKHPTAQLDAEGKIFFFPELEKQKKTPTPVEIEQGLKITEYNLLHQKSLSKYDRLN